ncbi:VanZ family protein [Ammoniphilus sp. YIM 78166]|uniref:VanZ family protein n=1 Tax=Ammoniphilus sp. YIM 78166 TaxID=1644106 RepID=UPI001431D4B0|nr:VanZ family protein [Ammoniphilus sp. YIM 78166]
MIGIDKVYHFFFYGIIALILGTVACQLSPKGRALQRIFGVACLLFLVGILDEYRQFFLPGRDTEYLDVLANGAGIVTGLVVPIILHRMELRKGTVPLLTWIPAVLLLVPLFTGIVLITTKAPPTPFFVPGSEKAAGVATQVVRLNRPKDKAYQQFREKYVPQLLYIEKEYKRELKELLSYAKQGNVHHYWLMYKLGQAVDLQFEQVMIQMKRSANQEGIQRSVLKRAEKEFYQRQRVQRAKLVKQVLLEK